MWEAKVLVERWRCEDIHIKPHSALGYQTPQEYAASAGHQDPNILSWTGTDSGVNVSVNKHKFLDLIHSVIYP